MSYYFTKELNSSMEAAITKVTEELKKEGFGILSDIDMKAKLKEKLNVEFRPYRILGACNPTFGFQALQTEDKIGTMLPCNVVVQEKTPGKVEVTAIDPVASMAAVNNANLKTIMEQPRLMLKKIIDNL